MLCAQPQSKLSTPEPGRQGTRQAFKAGQRSPLAHYKHSATQYALGVTVQLLCEVCSH